MDRTWMNHKGTNNRKKPSYIAGAESFLEFAFTTREVGAKLRCQCLNCNFQLFHDRDTMKCHLIAKGIIRGYNPWVHHGETLEHVSTSDRCQHETWIDEDDDVSNDELIVGEELSSLLNDASRAYGDSSVRMHASDDNGLDMEFEHEFDNGMPKDFHKLMQVLELDLYPGCKTFKRLEFIVTLLHIKVSCNWTDNSYLTFGTKETNE
ncbi:TPR and ankyrin repeat-containing protein 1 [Bienertia sinuspersici]